MPRSRKKAKNEFPAQEPEPALLAAATVKAAQDAITDARERKALTEQRDEPERTLPDQAADFQPRGAHTAAVLAKRPALAPAPPGFFEVASDRQAGIRVSKSHDKRVAAIQFAEDCLPSRQEKDVLERVGLPDDGQNFVYRPERKQWERPVPEGWALGENTIDAERIIREIAEQRTGRGR